MTTELATRKANALATSSANPFEVYGDNASNQRIVGKLLKFSKGDYLAGQDGEEVPVGTKLVAVMDTLTVGWIKWQDARPVEHRMGPIAEGYAPPPRSELGDTEEDKWDLDDRGEPRDPWQFSNYLILLDAETKDAYTFTTSSRGGLGAIGELSKAYGKRIRQEPDCYPVIELEVGSYQHTNREFGRIKYPIFKITEWAMRKGTYLAAINGAASSAKSESEIPF